MNETSGAVVWITGLSGTGKTTLSEALRKRLREANMAAVCLDGDVIRAVMGDLGYKEADRRVQIGRIQKLAKALSDQGITVIVAALYSHPDLLTWNREHFGSYVEVYLCASLAALRRRDGKGLYSGVTDVVGIDIPWHAPTAPDVIIDTNDFSPPDALAEDLVAVITKKTSGQQRR
jgi:cytidine diphosphoramidate kinase